jgi:hypothetical protein
MPLSEKDKALPWHSPKFYEQAHALAAARVRFIEHRGKRVLFIDFSNADLDLVRAVAAEGLHVMASQPPKSLLCLVEVEGIPFSTDALTIGKEMTDLGHHYSLRTAVSGVTGFRSFLLQTIADAAKSTIKLFKERDKALEWLLEEKAESSRVRR